MPARSQPPGDKREYVRISVDIALNPKLATLDNPAAGWLAVVAIAYCGQNLTDGEFIPGVVYRLAGVEPQVGKDLIDVGLWHEPGHDCQRCPQPGDRKLIVHDYLQHQRSKDEAQSLRSVRSKAGAEGARKRWSKPKPVANAMASAMANAWQVDGKPMAEVEEEEEKELFPTPDGVGVPKQTQRRTLDEHFADWWSAYPLKKGKGAARTAWDKARSRASTADLLAAVQKFAADPNLPRDRSKIPWPQKWLNEERWNDDPYPTSSGDGPAETDAAGNADPDVVLGRDLWSLPVPPDHIQPGTPGYAQWAREQWTARHEQRKAEAAAVLERRRSA